MFLSSMYFVFPLSFLVVDVSVDVKIDVITSLFSSISMLLSNIYPIFLKWILELPYSFYSKSPSFKTSAKTVSTVNINTFGTSIISPPVIIHRIALFYANSFSSVSLEPLVSHLFHNPLSFPLFFFSQLISVPFSQLFFYLRAIEIRKCFQTYEAITLSQFDTHAILPICKHSFASIFSITSAIFSSQVLLSYS